MDNRLDITVFTGMAKLFLQFNFTEEEKNTQENEWAVLTLMIHKKLKMICDELKEGEIGRIQKGNYGKTHENAIMETLAGDKYELSFNKNLDGICLSVKWWSPSKDDALQVVNTMLDAAVSCNYDVKTDSDELDQMIMQYKKQAIQLAKKVRSDIFEMGLVSYSSEFVGID